MIGVPNSWLRKEKVVLDKIYTESWMTLCDLLVLCDTLKLFI